MVSLYMEEFVYCICVMRQYLFLVICYICYIFWGFIFQHLQIILLVFKLPLR